MPRLALPAIALLTLPAFFLGLSVPFIGPDEPRYAEVGREMWQSGDMITPTLSGYHWFEKPPLLYWLESLFYGIFGVNEFAARLGPALCGLGTILCLWLLGRLALDPEEKHLANWFALIGVSTLGVVVFSHAATTDIVVTLPLTVAMSAFFVYDRRAASEARGWKLHAPLAVMYIAAGFAMLAKGLIGLVFPPAIIVLYCIFSRRMPSPRLMLSSLWGIPLTLAVAAVWYVPMYSRYGDEFISEFIIRQHFERFTTNIYQHPQPFYFYLYVLPLMTLPWLPLCVAGVWKALRKVVKPTDGSLSSSLLLFSLAWLLVPLVFFSASTSKLPGYVLAAVPPAIILAAAFAYELSAKRRVWSSVTAIVAGATLVVVSILLLTAYPARAREESAQPLLTAANERGYGSAKVLLLHSYNFGAEFYAQGRFDHDPTGKQLQLFGAEEVRRAIEHSGGSTALVIVPKQYVPKLFENADLDAQILAENSADAIFAVSLK
ncbi:MAG: ArnT family glycosyltransferase [Pyrinomonadaceae bacterium]